MKKQKGCALRYDFLVRPASRGARKSFGEVLVAYSGRHGSNAMKSIDGPRSGP